MKGEDAKDKVRKEKERFNKRHKKKVIEKVKKEQLKLI